MNELSEIAVHLREVYRPAGNSLDADSMTSWKYLCKIPTRNKGPTKNSVTVYYVHCGALLHSRLIEGKATQDRAWLRAVAQTVVRIFRTAGPQWRRHRDSYLTLKNRIFRNSAQHALRCRVMLIKDKNAGYRTRARRARCTMTLPCPFISHGSLLPASWIPIRSDSSPRREVRPGIGAGFWKGKLRYA
jgi:hypothetical protein